MLLVISKFLVLPFYPLGFIFVMIAVAFWALVYKKTRVARWSLAAGGVVLYVFSTDPLCALVVRSLERLSTPQQSYPAASAVVLLTGAEIAVSQPRLYDEINEAGDRVLYAARLMQQKTAERLIITGGTVSLRRTIQGTESEASFRMLTQLFTIDSSLILLEKKARSTYENGLYTKKLLDSLGMPPTIILVTSAMHMPRSAAIFRKLNCTVYPAPTDYQADSPFQFKLIGLFPTIGALVKSSAALHEYYGIFAYWLLGRL